MRCAGNARRWGRKDRGGFPDDAAIEMCAGGIVEIDNEASTWWVFVRIEYV